MAIIRFEPYQKELDVPKGTNLMKAIIQAELPIGSSCGGVGVCTKCLIQVIEGADNLSKANPIEKKLVAKEKVSDDFRVSCQTKVLGPVTIKATYW